MDPLVLALYCIRERWERGEADCFSYLVGDELFPPRTFVVGLVVRDADAQVQGVQNPKFLNDDQRLGYQALLEEINSHFELQLFVPDRYFPSWLALLCVPDRQDQANDPMYTMQYRSDHYKNGDSKLAEAAFVIAYLYDTGIGYETGSNVTQILCPLDFLTDSQRGQVEQRLRWGRILVST